MVLFFSQILISTTLLFIIYFSPTKIYTSFIKYTVPSYALFIVLYILLLFMELELFKIYVEKNSSKLRNGYWPIYTHILIGISLNGWYFYNKSRIFIMVYNRKIEQLSNSKKKSLDSIFLMELEGLIELAKNDDISLIPKFNAIYPDLQDKLLVLNPKLSAIEYKCCVLIFLKFTTKDIAMANHITVRSVETRKNRLRKHFALSSNTDLYQWIANI